MFYIGIDIAKRSHQAAVTDISGNIIVKPFNFKNTAAGFAQFACSKIASKDIVRNLSDFALV